MMHSSASSTTSSSPSTETPQYATQPMMKPDTNKNIRLVCEIRVQARVRAGCDFSSLHVTDLPEGTTVLVEELIYNRARITHPIHGWISIFSKTGVQIIQKVNKETEKIGGKAIVPIRVKTNENIDKIIHIECKIVDYNEAYNMHKIQCETGSQRWVSLKDPNITYVAKNVRSETVHPKKQTEALLERFFSSDYPQFGSNSKELRQNLEIKKAEEDHLDADNNDLETQYEETQTVSTAPYASNHTARMEEMEEMEEKKQEDAQSTVETEETEIDDINDEEERTKSEQDEDDAIHILDDDKINTEFMDKEEFIKKMKEIEQRIIEHLHLRGYYEDNPDFWKYITKAKKIAIAKVQKERQKWLEANNRSNNYIC